MYDTNIGLDWGGTNSKIKKERLLNTINISDTILYGPYYMEHMRIICFNVSYITLFQKPI